MEPRPSPVAGYLLLAIKIGFYSLPMLGFLLALQVAPVLIENALTGRPVFLEAGPPTLTAGKLWLLFTGLLLVVNSIVFWSAIADSEGLLRRQPDAEA